MQDTLRSSGWIPQKSCGHLGLGIPRRKMQGQGTLPPCFQGRFPNGWGDPILQTQEQCRHTGKPPRDKFLNTEQ